MLAFFQWELTDYQTCCFTLKYDAMSICNYPLSLELLINQETVKIIKKLQIASVFMTCNPGTQQYSVISELPTLCDVRGKWSECEYGQF